MPNVIWCMWLKLFDLVSARTKAVHTSMGTTMKVLAIANQKGGVGKTTTAVKLTLNGLVAADAVLIPMQCEYYALEGLSDLVNTLRRIKQNLNKKIEIEGLLRTMFDPRSTLAQQVSEQLVKHFTSKLYHTVIPRNVRLAEAPSYGRPILAYDKSSKGAQAYLQLAEEMLARHEALNTVSVV